VITKAEAVSLAQAFNQGFSQRVDRALRAAAKAGKTSVQIGYEDFTNAAASRVAAELVDAGWTVVNDASARHITIS
jgi:hypothetical protein